MEHKQQSLTVEQKLKVFQDNFYLGDGSRKGWVPKKGDYYTTSRADLELYRIVDEDENYFYTVYCHDLSQNKSKWEKDDFLKGFGGSRILVSDWIFTI